MRFAPAAAFFALLIAGAAGETRATDIPKGTRPASSFTKAPAKAPAKAPVRVAKPQARPLAKVVASKRVAAPAVVVAAAPAVAPQAASAQPITYSGVVLGPNELALPGACVFVAGDRSRMVVTNAQGEFALTLPASQTGSLQVTYAGLAEAQLPMVNNNHTAMFVTLSKK